VRDGGGHRRPGGGGVRDGGGTGGTAAGTGGAGAAACGRAAMADGAWESGPVKIAPSGEQFVIASGATRSPWSRWAELSGSICTKAGTLLDATGIDEMCSAGGGTR